MHFHDEISMTQETPNFPAPMLQVLKHLYQQGRLNFTVGILAVVDDYTKKAW